MKSKDFKNLLLEVAVAAIASDGKIDDIEIKTLHDIETKSPYFSSIDLNDSLEGLLKLASSDISKFIENIIADVNNASFGIVEELNLLEIALRIIESDEVIELSEEEFVRKLRAVLKVDDLLLVQRFGTIKYLGLESHTGLSFSSQDEFIESRKEETYK